MVIWKFPLEIVDLQTVSMPLGARVLSVANQNGVLCMWALVDPNAARCDHRVEIMGTGNSSIPNIANRKFIGTVLMGHFVWHVFVHGI